MAGWLALGPNDRSMDWKGMIADHMGHFSAYDIPGVVFVLAAACLFSFIVSRWGGRRSAMEARSLALWSTTAALATAFVRSQLPLAALVLAAAVLVGKRTDDRSDSLFLAALLIGIGCGSGASVIVGVALVPYFIILRWAARTATR